MEIDIWENTWEIVSLKFRPANQTACRPNVLGYMNGWRFDSPEALKKHFHDWLVASVKHGRLDARSDGVWSCGGEEVYSGERCMWHIRQEWCELRGRSKLYFVNILEDK